VLTAKITGLISVDLSLICWRKQRFQKALKTCVFAGPPKLFVFLNIKMLWCVLTMNFHGNRRIPRIYAQFVVGKERRLIFIFGGDFILC